MINNAFKYAAAVVIGTIAISAPSFAQDAAKPAAGGHHGERQLIGKKIAMQLNLTVEQQTKIKAIQDAMKAKAEPIKADTKLTDEQKKEQLKPLMKDSMKQILAILTPEQRAKLKDLREKAKEAKEAKEEKGEKEDKTAPTSAPKTP